MNVNDLIRARTEIFSITDSTSVHDAARYLRDKSGALVGIVSQSDISEKVAAENKCPAWMRVSEIMSTNLVTVEPETSLDDCLRLMEKHRIFHLLVVEARAGYRGLVSAKDLLKVIASDHKDRADLLESYIFAQH